LREKQISIGEGGSDDESETAGIHGRGLAQAQFCNILGYSPVKRSAIKLLTPETLAQQPKLDDPKTAVTDIKWWADNFVEANKRFKEWLLT
jgi:hypothetical protein